MTHNLEGREAPQAAAMGVIRSSSAALEVVHLRRVWAAGVRHPADAAREGKHGVPLATPAKCDLVDL